jgi:outer membrane protein assembly factor BamA
VIALLLLSGLLALQKPAPPAKSKPKPAKPQVQAALSFPVQSVRVTGAKNFSEAGILQVAGVRVGDPVSGSRFEAARQRLLETGVFVRAGYRYTPSSDQRGYDAVFEVEEIGDLYPYRFESLNRPDAELIAILKKNDPLFANRIPATEPFLKRYAALLEKELGEGVIGRTEAESGGGYTVLFRPSKPDPAIFQVTFRGNDVIPFQPLQRAMNAVAVGVPYKEERVRALLESAIRPLYEDRGRLEVKFPKLGSEPSAENKGVNVWVEVNEGPAYVFGDPWFSNNGLELGKVAALRPGDVASIQRVEEARVRIRDLYRRRGFLKAEVKYARKAKVEEGVHKLDTEWTIEEGPKYKFGKLEFRGLDLLTEPQIRKMWAMQAGEDYNAEYPDLFLARIREDQLMDDLGETRAIAKVDDVERAVDVTLEFKGAPKVQPKKRPF